MNVLWFEITEPSAYVSGGMPIGGWQDSLERIVRTVPSLELIVAFVSEKHSEVKVVNGVTYVPILVKWSFLDRVFRKRWDVFVEKVMPSAKRIVEHYKPDLIHVFGTEWPFGQIAAYTDIPVVIHIMGSIVPYNNASYPPGYSVSRDICQHWWNPIRLFRIWMSFRNSKNWEHWERKTWKLVGNYMGRTYWDESLSRVMHPGRKYFHVEEALRLSFIKTNSKWKLPEGSKIRLVSTGCSSFWKGPDMMLKVAKVLTKLGVDFEWKVAGNMPTTIKRNVEEHEGISFDGCNIKILGFVNPDELINILCSSTMYVHTAYIENSPNSICEAQCIGVPVVSTNVGGIASLVRHNIDGVLVPANDPWQMADAIIELSKDKDRMMSFSDNSRSFALVRHKDNNIKHQLVTCYKQILGDI